MIMKKNKFKLKQIQDIKQLKLKGLQLNSVDKSKVYLIELNTTADIPESFIEKARMVQNLFENQGIDVIIVPKNYMRIYKIGR